MFTVPQQESRPTDTQRGTDFSLCAFARPPRPTSPSRIFQSAIRSNCQALNPLESALPQNQILPFANPIASTQFLQITPMHTNYTPANPAFTTLTKHTSRNPIRMNTSAKHHLAPPPACLLTPSYKISYQETNLARPDHFLLPTPTSRQSVSSIVGVAYARHPLFASQINSSAQTVR